MRGRAFLDTNILIYSLSRDDPRSHRAISLVRLGGTVSVHVLNEFASAARRKLGLSWTEIGQAVDHLMVLCPDPIPLTLDQHRCAVAIADRYEYHIYDGLVIAAALAAESLTLWSEDMRDGQVIDGRLTIRDPFRDR